MKHFLLKFNHGLEIGAQLAYLGHYQRTKDPMVFYIAIEEEKHRVTLARLLKRYGHSPSKPIDKLFTIIGQTVAKLCQIAPLSTLNFIARTMEVFAIFSYTKLAKRYPAHQKMFREMARIEDRHKRYFK